MKTILILWGIIILAVLTASQKQNKGRKNCKAVKRPTCVPGKGGCLGRVVGVSYKTKDVTSRGFLVSWKKHKAAICYYVEVLKAYTTFQVQTITCFKGTSFKFSGLTPWTMYGVRVSLVNKWCNKGPPSVPVLNIKTKWDRTFVISTQAPRRQLVTPKPGKCGRNRFTCRKSKFKQKWRMECIPNHKWCDEIWDCNDGSDERGCPGGCKEIRKKFRNGNYSCSIFGSPGSYCHFDCDKGYQRDGTSYVSCEKGTGLKAGRWSDKLPVCRLGKPASFEILPDEITNDSIAVRWEEVNKAARYVIQAVHHGSGESDTESDVTVSSVVNATECCTGVVSGLTPGTEYEVVLYAIDKDDVRGLRSSTLFVETRLGEYKNPSDVTTSYPSNITASYQETTKD